MYVSGFSCSPVASISVISVVYRFWVQMCPAVCTQWATPLNQAGTCILPSLTRSMVPSQRPVTIKQLLTTSQKKSMTCCRASLFIKHDMSRTMLVCWPNIKLTLGQIILPIRSMLETAFSIAGPFHARRPGVYVNDAACHTRAGWINR